MLGILQRDRRPTEDGKAVRSQVLKVIEVVGTSDRDFSEAVRNAVRAASRTLHHISGVDVRHMTAEVKDGEIVEYRADVKIAFVLDEKRD